MRFANACAALRFCRGEHPLLLLGRKERTAVFTHLHFDHDDADMLFRAFAPKPLKEGEAGLVTRATLDEHFAEFGQTSLPRLGATMEPDRPSGLFVVKFREYLAHLPG